MDHQRGLEFIAGADAITPVFEFSTDPHMAEKALELFVEFWRDRGRLESILEQLERQRERRYGAWPLASP